MKYDRTQSEVEEMETAEDLRRDDAALVANYTSIPVEAARTIAEKYGKSVVIIIAHDPVYGLLHTTTYGRNPQEKAWAAQGGEIASRALGGIRKLGTDFEDYRLQQMHKLLATLRDIATRGTYGEGELPMTPSELREIARGAIAEAEKFLGEGK